MYPDPKRVRDKRITLCFDDYEHQLITALANYQGEQPGTLLRLLILREANSLLGLNDADSVARK
jgi:hypothetical protein